MQWQKYREKNIRFIFCYDIGLLLLWNNRRLGVAFRLGILSVSDWNGLHSRRSDADDFVAVGSLQVCFPRSEPSFILEGGNLVPTNFAGDSSGIFSDWRTNTWTTAASFAPFGTFPWRQWTLPIRQQFWRWWTRKTELSIAEFERTRRPL